MGRDTTITVNTHRNNPSTLKMRITGFANDTFAINKVVIPGGSIDTNLFLDWYTKILTVEYKKYKATKGEIEIEYSLH